MLLQSHHVYTLNVTVVKLSAETRPVWVKGLNLETGAVTVKAVKLTCYLTIRIFPGRLSKDHYDMQAHAQKQQCL